MKSYNQGVALGFAAALTAACAGPGAEPRPESEALARSRLMLARLDRLEADLHSEATAIDTYAVLQQRHGEASQIACKVTDEHVNEMHRLLAAQLEKRKEKLAVRKHKKKLVALGRAPASSTRARSGYGKKVGRASASARSPSSAPSRASDTSFGGKEVAAPASPPTPPSPAAPGSSPSAAGRAPGNTSGALSMR
jgi:hypothetical protein